MLSTSFIAKKPVKVVTAVAAVLLLAGNENLASHSESIEAHTGQVHSLKLNLKVNLAGGFKPLNGLASFFNIPRLSTKGAAREAAEIAAPASKEMPTNASQLADDVGGTKMQTETSISETPSSYLQTSISETTITFYLHQLGVAGNLTSQNFFDKLSVFKILADHPDETEVTIEAVEKGEDTKTIKFHGQITDENRLHNFRKISEGWMFKIECDEVNGNKRNTTYVETLRLHEVQINQITIPIESKDVIRELEAFVIGTGSNTNYDPFAIKNVSGVTNKFV